MPFSSFGLRAEIVRAVTERGYTHPTPVQARAIPVVMAGGDLMAGAQTGTGKTAGFTLPILHRLAQREVEHAHGKAAPRALVLTPTRELAAQVEQSVRDYGVYLPLTSMSMFGGVSMEPQLKRLRQPVDIVVATPGRLLDHVQQKTLDLSRVEILVLDEADRMLDMGFIQAIRRILSLLPKQRQNLLFSATFSRDIKQLAASLLHEPTLIEVEPNKATADLIGQRVYWVDRERKRSLLAHLIKTQDWVQVLVFTRTKHGADRLAEQLERGGITALALHSNKRQSVRTRTLAQFKNGELRVLVATDIAARGIDISELPHVVNYDMPNTPEDYVHRIGRTGRAGVEGEAVSLVSIEEHEQLAEIEKLIKQSIPHSSVPGFEPGSLADLDDDEARAERRHARQQRTQTRDSRGAKPRAGGERKPRSGRGGGGGNRRSNGQAPRGGESTSR